MWTNAAKRSGNSRSTANVAGLLEGFDDAQVAAMTAPRSLIIEAAKGPEVQMPGGNAYTPSQEGNGAPGTPRLSALRLEDVKADRFERARTITSAQLASGAIVGIGC